MEAMTVMPPALPPSSRRRLLQGLAALAASGWLPAAPAQPARPALSQARLGAMSTTLTGFAYTDPLATTMLQALTDAVGADVLNRIATLAAVIAPDRLGDELRIAGLERQATVVTVALYSGVVATPRGAVVVTYDEALAWQAVPWTKPNAQCGGLTDYWSTAPVSK
jgi:hypothetical protein